MESIRTTCSPPTPKQVLIAEDDPVTRHLVAAVIKKAGYEAVEAIDGRGAYRILKSNAEFCAAIFDMTMPYLDGIDLIRYMRTEQRLMRIPIMLITADADFKLMGSSFSAGATAFLPKPFTPEQLETALRMLLRPRNRCRAA